MQIVKVNEAEQILIIDVEPATVFEYNGCLYIRTQNVKTAVIGEGVFENVLATNLHDGSFLLIPRDSEEHVYCIPQPTAKLVIE